MGVVRLEFNGFLGPVAEFAATFGRVATEGQGQQGENSPKSEVSAPPT